MWGWWVGRVPGRGEWERSTQVLFVMFVCFGCVVLLNAVCITFVLLFELKCFIVGVGWVGEFEARIITLHSLITTLLYLAWRDEFELSRASPGGCLSEHQYRLKINENNQYAGFSCSKIMRHVCLTKDCGMQLAH